jgi:hypothetical protein
MSTSSNWLQAISHKNIILSCGCRCGYDGLHRWVSNSYPFNGKEFVEMKVYDTPDCGTRRICLAIMWFEEADPLAAEYYSMHGNPSSMRYADLTRIYIKSVWKGIRVVNKAVDGIIETKKVSTITENAAKGKAFEKRVGKSLGNNKASQVTIEVADGTRTKVDFVQRTDGKVTLTEVKSSKTAPLTGNQKAAHPQIETSGGTVKGNKGIEIGLPAGEKIVATKVEVIRPEDLRKQQEKYVCRKYEYNRFYQRKRE